MHPKATFSQTILILLLVYSTSSDNSKLNKEIEDEDYDKPIDAPKAFKENLITEGKYSNPNDASAEAKHGSHLPGSAPKAQTKYKTASLNLASRFNLDPYEECNFSRFPIRNETLDQCKDEKLIKCQANSKYRSHDGSCNNLKQPNCGMQYSPFQRILPPDYADGKNAPRSGSCGPLFGARDITIKVHRSNGDEEPLSYGTDLMMSFGQFNDHDIVFTDQTLNDDGSFLRCCSKSESNNPECFVIKIPSKDPDYKGQNCMDFTRSSAYKSCSIDRREQNNTVTAFIDCSQVYGSSEDVANSLRKRDGSGELKSYISKKAGELLPLSPNKADPFCYTPDIGCFMSGDGRENQNPLITCMHVIFLRFHNYIARNLKKSYPKLDEETLYQESRKFVIACMQNEIYTRYLPIIIGDETMKSYRLTDSYTSYDDRICPGVYNEFSTAAFRLHTTVPNTILMSSDKEQKEVLLKDNYFNPTLVHNGKLEDLIRGAALQHQDEYDRILSNAVTKFLYRRLNTTLGLDLASISIQRGRDHGIPGYVYFIKKIHGIEIKTFDDLSCFLSEYCLDKIKSLYECPADVDLYTGLFCEKKKPGMIVGPSAAEIIGIGMHNLKYGDRFFYTHPGMFTKDQRREIDKTTLSSIICLTTNIKRIQNNPLIVGSPYIECKDIPKIDFGAWKTSFSKLGITDVFSNPILGK